LFRRRQKGRATKEAEGAGESKKGESEKTTISNKGRTQQKNMNTKRHRCRDAWNNPFGRSVGEASRKKGKESVTPLSSLSSTHKERLDKVGTLGM
jgi:hypothetical protein